MNNLNFSFPCPHCQKTITSQDFSENSFLIAHLQGYFQQKEQEYKAELLNQITQNLNSIPLLAELKSENERLKLLVEGYRLGTNKNSKSKGEELEKYILEQLQTSYNGADEISKITHVGTKADILQIVHNEQQQEIGKIIYEIKNEEKWDSKWLEKLSKDMVNDRADFGILVATCRQGQPLWKPTPQQNILVSDEDNFLFASQIARLLIFSKLKIKDKEDSVTRIKKWEEWIKDKLPNYLLKLEKYFSDWEKDLGRISTSLKSMEKTREEVRKLILSELEVELRNI
ncbi:MAG: hypothetical protein mread185_000112 [Mycoplasmataceae bacterium]|nr:MAG: hypothetical protein mread185_000112 [Mycoplasmataceae bacterium]